MSSRTRGHKVKSDLTSLPLLRHIPSKSMVTDRMQPLYYELLAAYCDAELDLIQQGIAILLARSYCTLIELYMYRDRVLNEADAPQYRAPLEDIDKVSKAFSEYVKLFYSVTKTKPRDEPETETMDPLQTLQAEIEKLRNDSSRGETE